MFTSSLLFLKWLQWLSGFPCTFGLVASAVAFYHFKAGRFDHSDGLGVLTKFFNIGIFVNSPSLPLQAEKLF